MQKSSRESVTDGNLFSSEADTFPKDISPSIYFPAILFTVSVTIGVDNRISSMMTDPIQNAIMPAMILNINLPLPFVLFPLLSKSYRFIIQT